MFILVEYVCIRVEYQYVFILLLTRSNLIHCAIMIVVNLYHSTRHAVPPGSPWTPLPSVAQRLRHIDELISRYIRIGSCVRMPSLKTFVSAAAKPAAIGRQMTHARKILRKSTQLAPP